MTDPVITEVATTKVRGHIPVADIAHRLSALNDTVGGATPDAQVKQQAGEVRRIAKQLATALDALDQLTGANTAAAATPAKATKAAKAAKAPKTKAPKPSEGTS